MVDLETFQFVVLYTEIFSGVGFGIGILQVFGSVFRFISVYITDRSSAATGVVLVEDVDPDALGNFFRFFNRSAGRI